MSKGSKYEETKHLPAREVAKLVRADIKAALKAGELPSGLDARVRTGRSTYTSTIDIYVHAVPESFRAFRPEYFATGYGWASDEAIALLNKLDGILRAYNRDDSDLQSDYFDVHFYGRASFDHDCLESQRKLGEAEAARPRESEQERFLAWAGAS